jgi:hypothetical protein
MSRNVEPLHASRDYAGGRAVARYYAPVFEYPCAERIAAELARMPDLLRLRTRRLAADVMAVKGCGLTTARRAVAFARELVA